MSHPDPNGPVDLTPIQHGEVLENPVTGERFSHMIETLFGLDCLGHTDAKGMPPPLQLAFFGREFSDVLVFRSSPPAVQRALFGVLSPLARWRGYRATYPQLSRTVLAPRE